MPSPALTSLDEVTERLHALEAELRHSDRLATLGAMAAGVAHEVNNQLTPSLAYAQMLKEASLDPSIREKAIDRIIAGVATASRILETILDFARPDAVSGSASVDDAVESSILLCHKDLERSGIRVECALDRTSPVAMSTTALQQVLVNLLVNARKAMRTRGGGRIDVVAMPEGREVVIDVRDDGPGIPSEIRDRLFEPFVHGGGGGSYGLGLAMSRRLVEAAGGSLTVAHPQTGGAVFQIRLPVAPEGAMPLFDAAAQD